MAATAYSETGGIRYGRSFWMATKFTWPFATLTVTQDQISIHVTLGRLWSRTFTFDPTQIKSIRKKRVLYSVGIEIDHSITEYPIYILFWTFRYKTLKKELEKIGYEVTEKRAPRPEVPPSNSH